MTLIKSYLQFLENALGNSVTLYFGIKKYASDQVGRTGFPLFVIDLGHAKGTPR